MENVSGWFSYKNLTTQQHNQVGDAFRKLFSDIKPKRILEIGTAYGGLTLMIRDILNELDLESTILRTYDITDKHGLNQYIDSGYKIEVIIKQLFDITYTELVEQEEVKSFIQSDGPTIILCDGGNKKSEFNLLSHFMKKGDIIMAHDYSPNETFFYEHIKDKIWNWLEIQDSDIESSVSQNNLSPFMSDEFSKVVWVCKQKN